jgi:enoyl-CoA hydratase
MSAQNASTLAYEPLSMSDIPLSPEAKITVERRGQIVLIGVNRPQLHNRFDPDAFFGLARAYYDFDNDPSLRAAVLFGHGENFSRGIDVDAFAPLARTGQPFAVTDGMLDPFARTQHLGKPLIAVVHGDTWNMGHELHLVADIRVASADTRFGQDENTHGRFPGGGSTIRFPREAGWGNAMRYMLTGDHWGAEEAYRMSVIQQIAPSPAKALEAGIGLARKIAACGPLGTAPQRPLPAVRHRHGRLRRASPARAGGHRGNCPQASRPGRRRCEPGADRSGGPGGAAGR